KHVSARKEKYAKLARKILREIQSVPEARASGRAGIPNTNGRVDLTIATYALFGMMNWIYNWYDPSGKLSVNQLVDNITRLFLNGFLCSSVEPVTLSGSRTTEKVSVWRTA